MDSITHNLMGLTIYGSVNKKEMSPKVKRAILLASIAGSNIPDIDILYKISERGRIMYQMLHRGLSHSLIMAPLWALIIYLVCYLIWDVKSKIIFYVALINVFLHIAFDALNTWGTGLFEPFSQTRVSLGVISIIDVVIWIIILSGFIFSKVKKTYPKYKVWRIAWLVIFFHVTLQSIQGQIIHNEARMVYDKSALSADFIPWRFSVIGKKGNVVEIYSKTIFSEKKMHERLYSNEEVDLEPLFSKNPKAKVLIQWSPFVVIVEDENKIAIYDPRFYRNGSSFLYEYIKKDEE